MGGGRLASQIGGRWDWWEVDSQSLWEVRSCPPPSKQVGLGLRPLPHTPLVHFLAFNHVTHECFSTDTIAGVFLALLSYNFSQIARLHIEITSKNV